MNNFDTICSRLGVPVAQEKNGRSNNKTSLFGFSDRRAKNVNTNSR